MSEADGDPVIPSRRGQVEEEVIRIRRDIEGECEIRVPAIKEESR